MMNESTSKLVDEVQAMSLKQLKKVAIYGEYLINYPPVTTSRLGWKIGKFHIQDVPHKNELWNIYTDRPLYFPISGDKRPRGITQSLKVLYIIAKIFDPIVNQKGEVFQNISSKEVSELRDQVQAAIYSITH